MIDLDALKKDLRDNVSGLAFVSKDVSAVRSIEVRIKGTGNPNIGFEIYEDGDVEALPHDTTLVGPSYFTTVDVIRRHIIRARRKQGATS